VFSPYLSYAVALLVVLLAYPLGWSNRYPKLQIPLLAFIVGTVLICIVLAEIFRRKKIITFKKLPAEKNARAVYITVFIYFLWVCEFIYEGGIPLFKLLFNIPFDYRLFGIPSLHVFIVTFSSFYTVFLFHNYLSSRKKSLLYLFLLNLVAGLLIYNRGMIVFNLCSSVFLYVMSLTRISGKVLAIGTFAIVGLIFIFGVLGNIRVSHESKISYTNELFLDLGLASENFRSSMIPHEFFWGYVYLTSPLANLQKNIESTPVDYDGKDVAFFVTNEIVMDFISKRINGLFGHVPPSVQTIGGPFNVSTVYSRAYSYLGWTGMTIMFLVILMLPWAYLRIMPANSAYHLTGLAILNTVFLFLVFDNTIRFTGLFFQLSYPFIFHLFDRIRLQRQVLHVNH
jgi:hypothetical protein